MSGSERERLRATFDQAAELYDRARPGYPVQLIDDLVELADIGSGSRVLEIGCGTGQLTAPLAARGCEIVAVEMGPDMAAVARRNLARFGNVRVEVSAFEDWPLPKEPFDAVVSATAFHWIDPDVRVVKSAAALRPRGALATIATHHVSGGDSGFFEESQACYQRWDPTTVPGFRLPSADDVSMGSEELDRSGRFEPAIFRRYEWELSYSSEEYLALLQTYSGHRALAPENRRNLLACIGELIDTRYAGRITKRYLSELRIANLRRIVS